MNFVSNRNEESKYDNSFSPIKLNAKNLGGAIHLMKNGKKVTERVLRDLYYAGNHKNFCFTNEKGNKISRIDSKYKVLFQLKEVKGKNSGLFSIPSYKPSGLNIMALVQKYPLRWKTTIRLALLSNGHPDKFQTFVDEIICDLFDH